MLHPAIGISLALAATGLVLWLHHRFLSSRSKHGDAVNMPAPGEPDAPADNGEDNNPDTPREEQCCGMHITCERDSLSTAVADSNDYYDDEELDQFRGRQENQYTEAETDRFRDVLLTLLPDDIAPWARAIQRRGITLPAAVRDELLMIVAEARAARRT